MERFYLSKIPILNENNWDVWKCKMKHALERLELWPLKSEEDEKCYSVLSMYVGSFSKLIDGIRNPKEIWNVLEGHFQQKKSNTELSLDSNVIDPFGDDGPLNKWLDQFHKTLEIPQESTDVAIDDEKSDLPEPLIKIDHQEESFEGLPLVGEIDLDFPDQNNDSTKENISIMKTIPCESKAESQPNKLLKLKEKISTNVKCCLEILKDENFLQNDSEKLLKFRKKFFEIITEVDNFLKEKKDDLNNQKISSSDENVQKEIPLDAHTVNQNNEIPAIENGCLSEKSKKADPVRANKSTRIPPRKNKKGTSPGKRKLVPRDQFVSYSPDSYMQVNNLYLWPRLRLLNREFLSQIDRFYTIGFKHQVWLFMKNGSVFHFGYTPMHGDEIINDLAEVTELNQQKIISVHSGNDGDFYMFLSEEKKLFGIGKNDYGQLGIGSTELQTNPVLISDDIKQVSIGDMHTLALNMQNEILSCGSNAENQVCYRSPKKLILQKIIFFLGQKFKMIQAGKFSSIALTENDELYIWGEICNHKYTDPENLAIKKDVPVKKLVFGIRDILILRENGLIEQYFFGPGSPSYQIVNLDFIPKDCFHIFGSTFMLVDMENHCFTWKGLNGGRAVFSNLKSVPDAGNYCSCGQTTIIAKLPTILALNVSKLTKFNEISSADLKIRFQDVHAPIYAHREILSKRSKYFEKSSNQIEFDHSTFFEMFNYIHYIYTGSFFNMTFPDAEFFRSFAKRMGDEEFEKEIDRFNIPKN